MFCLSLQRLVIPFSWISFMDQISNFLSFGLMYHATQRSPSFQIGTWSGSSSVHGTRSTRTALERIGPRSRVTGKQLVKTERYPANPSLRVIARL